MQIRPIASTVMNIQKIILITARTENATAAFVMALDKQNGSKNIRLLQDASFDSLSDALDI